WYPFSLAIGLSAMNGAVQWETFAAIAFGHLYRVLQLESRLLPVRRLAGEIESRWMPKVPGLLVAMLGGRWIPALQQWPQFPPQQVPDRSEQRDRGRLSFQIFSGQGHRLGD
ncbi:unnamed protein product, partial [Polarella glacialis]